MKSCQIASISRLGAPFNPIGGDAIGATLHDDINSSYALHISIVTLCDAIFKATYINHKKLWNIGNK